MSRTVPKLRFPGFAGAWPSQLLGDFIDEYREKSTTQDQHEVLTSARSGIVRQRDYFESDRLSERDNVGFNIIPPGYITYRSRSDDRRFYFNRNDLGITGIISIFYPVFRLIECDPKFFTALLDRYVDEIGKYSVGTSQTVLSLNQLRKISLPLPSLVEQAKIGSILGTVDAKLEALRRKKSGLETFKSGLMQRLFSQTLRFRRDDGTDFPDWEGMTLGQIFTVCYGKDHKALGDGNIPVYGTGGVMRHVDRELWHGPSILIGRKGTIDRPMLVDGPFWTVDTLFYTRLNEGFNPRLVFALVEQVEWATLNEATGVPSLTSKAISNVRVFLPPDPDEQRKIADALAALDAKIAAVADQITHMEAFKKGLLQQMFV